MSKFKQNSIFCFLVFLTCIAWMGLDVPMVLAQASAIDNNLGNPINSVLSTLAYLTSWMKILLLFILQYLEYFMNTDFYSAPGMSSALKNIWKVSRDIMNYVFLFLLLGAALYTVIKANKDFIKEKLGTFVIAVICVNFSWFFPRVIIDIANVLTNTVFSLPSFIKGSSDWKCINEKTAANQECQVMVFNKESFKPDEYRCIDGFNEDAFSRPCDCAKGIACWDYMPYGEARTKKGYGYATFNTFATSIINIPDLDKVYKGPVQANIGWQATIKLGLGILFSTFIYVALLFPLIALCIALMLRIVIIWVCTAFMPFAFFGLAFTGKDAFGKIGEQYNIWTEFIGAVFIPVYFGIPMSIGIIMLSATASIPNPPMGDIQVPFLNAVNGVWGLTWMIAALVIIWIGTFASFKGSKIISMATEKVKSFGEGLGSGLSSIAAAGVVLPLPPKLGGGNISGKKIQEFLKNPRAALERHANKIDEINTEEDRLTKENDLLQDTNPNKLTKQQIKAKAKENIEGKYRTRDSLPPGLYNDNQKLSRLEDQIGKLEAAYRSGSTSKQGDIVKEIHNEIKIDIQAANPQDGLRRAIEALAQQRQDNGLGTGVTDTLRKKLGDLETAMRTPRP